MFQLLEAETCHALWPPLTNTAQVHRGTSSPETLVNSHSQRHLLGKSDWTGRGGGHQRWRLR